MLNCSDEKGITEITEGEVIFSSHQVTGCNHNKELAKTSPLDSCFTYSFDEKLEIDFCVIGNCYPDSQRFSTNYFINSDTIFVSVEDTARNSANCICSYKIHLDFTGLQKDKYLFYCNYPIQDAIFEYREYVYKLK